MTRTILAAIATLVLGTSAALAQSEQPHPGFISPTYGSGHVGIVSGESAGTFSHRTATPLLGGGHIPGQHSAEAGGGFVQRLAISIGRQSDGSRVTALSGGIRVGG
ncbi:hypothetical protein [Elioraea sp.]|uniref:hypothetical protein n=1 Tax=Elioraea sp. TaxID=2185103 RepID=UPI003F6E6D2F